jgi:hypothetical protein
MSSSRGRLLAVGAVSALAAFGTGIAGAAPSGPAASGAGHFQDSGGLRTFAFNAKTMPNGSIQGQAELFNRGQDTRDHIAIDCMQVVGDTAYISGTFTDSSNPALIGDTGVFSVRDNGEGSNAPADQMSLVYYAPPSTFFNCNYYHYTPDHTLDGGNVQIR